MKKPKPTKEQQSIINHSNGHAYVQAGPGCAKTTTLVLCVQKLLKKGVKPSKIVMLTHSKKLSAETKNKCSRFRISDDIHISTIHSFAFKLIKGNFTSVGYKNSPDEESQSQKEDFIKEYAKKHEIKSKELKRAFHIYDTSQAEKIEKFLGKKKAKLAMKTYQKYSRIKKKKKLLSFSDMIKLATLLVMKHPSLIKRKYKHLLVDEIQDLDKLQTKFLIAMAKLMKSDVFVGDAYQAIYRWRGASPDNLKTIKEELNPKCFQLSLSFRLPQNAMKLVNHQLKTMDKNAPVLKSNHQGGCPELLVLKRPDAKYDYMARTIKRLIKNGIALGKIAILAKTNKELRQTSIALRARSIDVNESYRVDNKNSHRKLLKAAIQLARLEKKRMTKQSKQFNKSEKLEVKKCIGEMWFDINTIKGMQRKFHKKPEKLIRIDSKNKHYDRINRLSNAIVTSVGLQNVESAVACLIDACSPIVRYHNTRDKLQRKCQMDDLNQIKVYARHCKTLDDIKEEWFKQPKRKDGITLMTCTSAKGQEWDYVFVINVVDRVFPSHLSKKKGIDTVNDESCLFFVTITRHHAKLYLLESPKSITKFSNRGKIEKTTLLLNNRSPFVKPKKQGLKVTTYI
ncbi:MAG: hypothetical protein DM484_18935 [Candidatus Methylumidiphilus alinenensis]|uniref:DNA 3'-5' helicase n=1 Tax=Candidatus Methylumidiphilus alinenensis TaxID=2202197 RepID=A0A2W4SIP8_9GAMM|nr:MAG: hypothetical protein DM484_18935 [Candidatus Methylumidiphilus alinenensis]